MKIVLEVDDVLDLVLEALADDAHREGRYIPPQMDHKGLVATVIQDDDGFFKGVEISTDDEAKK